MSTRDQSSSDGVASLLLSFVFKALRNICRESAFLPSMVNLTRALRDGMAGRSTTMNVRRALVATLAVAASGMAVAPLQAQWGFSVSVSTARTAPPPLPEYDQPEAPGDGYLWTPGYW